MSSTTNALEIQLEPHVSEDQTLVLNQADSEAFVEALFNPPHPNEALKAAAQRYRQLNANHSRQ
jgi:uncharacterized protein (DUF1778 family)